jgi:putative ABC transport system permease protein
LASIHLDSQLVSEIGSPGSLRDVTLFAVLGMLILIISCINFTNLTTARSTNRAKEIGVRKAVGAFRIQLARQFLFESVLASWISLILSFIIVLLALPYFNMLKGQSLERRMLFNPVILLGLVGFSICVGLMAGSYPAFILSRFRAVSALKGPRGLNGKGNLSRKALVVAQFSITIILAIGALSIYKQIGFMKNTDLGFDKYQKMIVPAEMGDAYESVKREFLSYPSITDATACWNAPGRLVNLIEARLVGENDEKTQSMNFYYVDSDFIPQYKIGLVAGRPFQREIQTDVSNTFILNETAAKAFGFSSPEEALGKKMYEGGSGGVGTIIGVVKDFHYKGLQTIVEPLVLQWKPDLFSYLSLTLETGNLSRTISFVEKKWNDLKLGRLFAYFFLDEDFNRHYRSEESVGRLYAALTFLAVFLSCMGLAGLSSYAAERRTKEIGIRKVLGASSPSILFHLVSEFAKWVILANLVAWPVGYFAMRSWLRNFAYRTSLTVPMFVGAALAAFLIAAATISVQTYRAAAADPARSMRYE